MAQALASKPCRAKAVSLSKVTDERSRGSSRRNTAIITATVSGDKVEGDLAQKGEVTGGGAVAYPAVVLAEGDVEDPVQRVLDAPVSADGLDQDGRIVAAAGEEVADLG